MATYVNLIITRRIKIHGPRPENFLEKLDDEISVEYPFDVEEIDGSVESTVEDAN